jgi:hypothetical protein
MMPVFLLYAARDLSFGSWRLASNKGAGGIGLLRAIRGEPWLDKSIRHS